jgi:hypothetical protein
VGCDQRGCASDPAPGGTSEAETADWRAEAGRTACRNPPSLIRQSATQFGDRIVARRSTRTSALPTAPTSTPTVDRPEQQGARQLQYTGPRAPSTGRTTARTTRALRGAVRWLSRRLDLRCTRALGPITSFSSTAWRSSVSVCLLVPPSGRPLDETERTGACGAVCPLGGRGSTVGTTGAP